MVQPTLLKIFFIKREDGQETTVSELSAYTNPYHLGDLVSIYDNTSPTTGLKDKPVVNYKIVAVEYGILQNPATSDALASSDPFILLLVGEVKAGAKRPKAKRSSIFTDEAHREAVGQQMMARFVANRDRVIEREEQREAAKNKKP